MAVEDAEIQRVTEAVTEDGRAPGMTVRYTHGEDWLVHKIALDSLLGPDRNEGAHVLQVAVGEVR